MFTYIKNWFKSKLYDKKRKFDPLSEIEIRGLYLSFLEKYSNLWKDKEQSKKVSRILMEFFKFIVKDLHPHSKTNFQFGEKEDVTTEIESCDYLPLC